MANPVAHAFATGVANLAGTATTGTMAVSAGDSVYAFISFGTAGGQTLTSVTDSESGTWTKVGSLTGASGTNTQMYIYVRDNVSASATFTATAHFSANTVGAIGICDVTGANSSGSFDTIGPGHTSATYTTNQVVSDSVTPTNGSDLLMAVLSVPVTNFTSNKGTYGTPAGMNLGASAIGASGTAASRGVGIYWVNGSGTGSQNISGEMSSDGTYNGYAMLAVSIQPPASPGSSGHLLSLLGVGS